MTMTMFEQLRALQADVGRLTGRVAALERGAVEPPSNYGRPSDSPFKNFDSDGNPMPGFCPNCSVSAGSRHASNCVEEGVFRSDA